MYARLSLMGMGTGGVAWGAGVCQQKGGGGGGVVPAHACMVTFKCEGVLQRIS